MDVSDILQQTGLETDRPIQFNSNYLVAFDDNPIVDPAQAIQQTCQAMINSLFSDIVVEDGVYARLQKKRILPRFKQFRKKEPTKWEAFAKSKGIKNKKKSRVQYDEERGEYLPTYGYKGYMQKEKDLSGWLKEQKDGDDQDPFEKENKEKRDRIEKNEKQRLNNIKRAQGSTASLGKFNSFQKQVLVKEKNFEYSQRDISNKVLGIQGN